MNEKNKDMQETEEEMTNEEIKAANEEISKEIQEELREEIADGEDFQDIEETLEENNDEETIESEDIPTETNEEVENLTWEYIISNKDKFRKDGKLVKLESESIIESEEEIGTPEDIFLLKGKYYDKYGREFRKVDIKSTYGDKYFLLSIPEDENEDFIGDVKYIMKTLTLKIIKNIGKSLDEEMKKELNPREMANNILSKLKFLGLIYNKEENVCYYGIMGREVTQPNKTQMFLEPYKNRLLIKTNEDLPGMFEGHIIVNIKTNRPVDESRFNNLSEEQAQLIRENMVLSIDEALTPDKNLAYNTVSINPFEALNGSGRRIFRNIFGKNK